MSYYEEQIQLYPELLRRLASGERLASRQDETEKLAATALVVEALENQKAEPENGHEKQALLAEVAGGAAAAHFIPKAIRKLRGEPAVPETAAEMMKNFRKILQEQEATRKAQRMAVAAGIGGVAAGGLAVKALEKDKKEAADKDDKECPPEKKSKKDDDEKDEKKKSAPPWVKDKDKDEEKEGSEKAASPRAVLDRIMKNFQ